LCCRIQTEGQARIESKRGVLADVESCEQVVALDGAIGDRIHVLRHRHDLATRKAADLEFAVGERRHPLAQLIGRTEKRVEALGPGGGHAPPNRGLRLSDRRHGDRYADPCGNCGTGQETTTLHGDLRKL